MKTQNRIFGDFGESIAKYFLKKKGYNIISSNFYTKYGEIDIVCSKNFEIFFVEVKTRKISDYLSYPEDAVDFNKKIRMDRAAQIFLNKNKMYNIFYSFSVVAIIINNANKKANIKFFERI